MNLLDVLTGSNWDAGLEHYDFLCRIEFRDDYTGTMKAGGAQVLRLMVDFKFLIIGDDRIKFEFLDTEAEGFFTNASFERTDLNAFRSVEFELSEGPFAINEPYLGVQNYRYKLRFNLSPFPINTDAEREYVDFYGWLEKNKYGHQALFYFVN